MNEYYVGFTDNSFTYLFALGPEQAKALAMEENPGKIASYATPRRAGGIYPAYQNINYEAVATAAGFEVINNCHYGYYWQHDGLGIASDNCGGDGYYGDAEGAWRAACIDNNLLS